MIEVLDRLVDTKEKRIALFGILTCFLGMLFLLPYVILACHLISLTSYDQVFSLLGDNVLSYTYLSRVIVKRLAYVDPSLPAWGMILVSQLRWLDGISIACVGLQLQGTRVKRLRRACMISVLLWLTLLCGCAIIAFQATTLFAVVGMLQVIGYGTFLFAIGWIIACLVILCRSFVPAYRHALSYACIEIKEE